LKKVKPPEVLFEGFVVDYSLCNLMPPPVSSPYMLNPIVATPNREVVG
jgi:hypothetical protein